MNGSVKRPLWFLVTQHWVSLLGLFVLGTAIVCWFVVLPIHIRGHVSNPYVGIVVFLILPAIFVCGLILVPIGVLLGKRRIREGISAAEFDRKSALRRLAWVLGLMTAVNVVIGTQLTYRAVEHMETPQFCGATCHTMAPEFAAYQNSPHSRIECVECHVTPGVAGWIGSKTAGLRQLVETARGTQPAPIPPALETGRLVPSRHTCEECHWPEQFGGVKFRVINRYAEDESNSRTQTVLMMLIGGGRIAGIHGSHVGPGIKIRFAVADPKRQEIPWIEYKNTSKGTSEEFAAAEFNRQTLQTLQVHEMQCVDCHNRPTHSFDLPDRAVDKAMSRGEISTSLPFIRKKATEVLRAPYSSREDAANKVPHAIADFYQHTYPDLYRTRSADVDGAARAILAIYNRNIFPDLKVTWGTYPNNIGHTDSSGCFRCHDGSHSTANGKSITQDCNTCHQTLATDEVSPEVLKTLGLAERISDLEKR
jgi:nitrate/TMAO reductase-like tetraheme cytochrome c subunit